MEIVEVYIADRADTRSLENGSNVNVRVFNMSEYHHVYLFVRIERIEDLDIP